MKALNIEIRVISPETIVLDIAGDVNIYNANDLRREFDRHMTGGTRNFVLNFGKMTMIDSAGIGVLFTILNRVKNLPGKVLIVHARPNVVKLFEITKVAKFFNLLESEAEAIKILETVPAAGQN